VPAGIEPVAGEVILFFQKILTLLIGMAILRLVIQFYKKRINAFFFLFFLGMWSTILFFNWNNIFLNKIGHLFGIDRGATVLVYIGLFLLFYYVFVSLVRFYIVAQVRWRILCIFGLNNF